MALCEAWATSDDLCSPCLEAYDLDPYVLEDYLLQASELLYMLSGQVYPGICAETVHPCQITRQDPFSNRVQTVWWDPFPFQMCGCFSFDNCSCSTHSLIELPRITVTEVTEVVLDGDVVDPSVYELSGNQLLRTDGRIWPCCNPTLEITYSYGRTPPRTGVKAAAVLACELLLACEPGILGEGATCRLPRNVTSITRQGVSVIFNSLTQAGRGFRFGIPEIDFFLEAFTSPRDYAVISPDTPMARRVP